MASDGVLLMAFVSVLSAASVRVLLMAPVSVLLMVSVPVFLVFFPLFEDGILACYRYSMLSSLYSENVNMVERCRYIERTQNLVGVLR